MVDGSHALITTELYLTLCEGRAGPTPEDSRRCRTALSGPGLCLSPLPLSPLSTPLVGQVALGQAHHAGQYTFSPRDRFCGSKNQRVKNQSVSSAETRPIKSSILL